MRRLGILALMAIAVLGAGAGWLESQIGRPYHGRRPDKVFVDIPRGASRWEVAGILRRNSIIRNRVAFVLFSDWHLRHPLQAGEYFFDQPLNSREVFWKIARGQVFVRHLTIPEGWSVYDVAAEIERQEICSREDFLLAVQDTSSISDLAPQAKNLEGFLFPSTYEFTRHTSCGQIVKHMVQNFRAVWGTLGPAGSVELMPGWTPMQAVTLASLVERETPNPEERPLVAGVFYNRLRRGYPLQCDPTVQYAMELAGNPEKKVGPKDLRLDSPYNTYRYRGLPPGPIANPGKASLQAALAPAQTDFMYFVANDRGGHSFSRTLEEHNRNVARLRRRLNGDPAPAVASKGTKNKHREQS